MVVRMDVGWAGMRVDESVEHWVGLSVVERVESTVVPRAEQWVVLKAEVKAWLRVEKWVCS